MEYLPRHRTIVFGPFQLSPSERTVFAGTDKLDIGSRAFDILLVLVTHPDQVVTHSMFSKLIWPDTVVEDVNLRVHIANLRRIFVSHDKGFRCIESVPGRGYRFVGKVLYEENSLGLSDVKALGPLTPSTDATENDYGQLVGRRSDLYAIDRLFAQNRLVTIVGPGGVGKTTVAFAAMRTYCAAHSINATCVELSSVGSPALVPSVLASALGIVVVGSSPLEAVISALRKTRAFLLIDCCERVVEGVTDAVEAICRVADGVTVLATSRELLRARDEWVYRLHPLRFPEAGRALSCDEALLFPAVKLFAERARAIVCDFSITPENVSEVCAICRALDGLPLAIELATARLEIFGTKGLLSGIDRRLSVLTRGKRTALPRHQTLRSTIDWSYETLSEAERTALRRISIFNGIFTLVQAAAVIGEETDILSAVLPCLTELVDKSLLTASPNGHPGTFRLLDSTRAYGLEKLVEHEELNDVAWSHASFLCALFTEPATFRAPTDTLDPQAGDHHLLDDVRSALDWSFGESGNPGLGVTLTWSSARLFYQISLFDEYRTRVDQALKFVRQAGAAEADARYRLQLALAQADFLTQGLQRGIAPKAFQAALALAEEFRDTARQIQALYGTIVMTVMAGDYGEAGDLASRMFRLTNERPADLALYHRLKALVDTQKGRLDPALAHARESLRLYGPSTTGDRPSDPTRYAHRPTVMALESRTLWLLGYADDAVQVAAQSVEEAVKLDHKLSLCCSLASGACPVACWRGDLSEVQRLLAVLQPLSNEMLLINWQGQAQCYAYALPGHEPGNGPHFWEQFDHLAPSSHEILATVNSRFLTPVAVDRAKSGKAGYATAEIYRALGENLLASGTASCEESEKLFKSAIAVAKRQGARSWQLRASTSLAKLQRRNGRTQEAIDLLYAALDQMPQGHGSRDYRNAISLLAEIRRRVA
jgi:predicted ATPase/DNA-binding winged helix-turn-helix (wHTH) protein